ncbi:cation:proton antiporter [Candidatus Woesearchaeota archaeon]|nr:cation:proton antiporter [Candidatus Woesearchaeota archaeon]
MASQIFFDIAIVVMIAAIGGYLAKLFRQPLIPAYILAGVIFGPSLLGVITDTAVIETLAEIGITFLLFVVGLELDWKRLKTASTVALFGGMLQMFLTFAAGMVVALLLGFSTLTAVYLALIITFSSTLVVVKILSDKKELDTLHGRILVGILLLQDLVAILALSILNSIDAFSPVMFLFALAKGIGLLVVAYILSKIAFPVLFRIAAKSHEVLLLLSISVCFFLALFAIVLDFSMAIGAFVAGVALSNLPYRFEIMGRVKPLRDFFSTLFFVSLGMTLTLETMPSLLIPILIFLFFVVFFKSFITMIIIKIFGYTTKTSFLTGLLLAQVSEFSFIIAALGFSLGHISQSIFSLMVVLAVLTIALTSYLARYDDTVYRSFSPYLSFLQKWGGTHRDLEYIPKEKDYQIVLVGVDRLGYGILQNLIDQKKSVLVVDYNPEIIRKCKSDQVDTLYGDIEDLDVIERINFKKVKLIISTVDNLGTGMFLTRYIKKKNKNSIIFVTAKNVQDALTLYREGADYVILPYHIGGDHVSLLMEEISIDTKKLIKHRKHHLQQIKKYVHAPESLSTLPFGILR